MLQYQRTHPVAAACRSLLDACEAATSPRASRETHRRAAIFIVYALNSLLMKSEAGSGSRQRTRRAILEAMADVITETNGIGFSVQAVANRAGVTHRTIYNYFSTREALCEAFSEYVDELLASAGGLRSRPSFPSRRCRPWWKTSIGRWSCASGTCARP